MSLFTELGMRYPIIQAPMAGVQGSELALAVTRAGGLGSLPKVALGHLTSTSSAICNGNRIPLHWPAGSSALFPTTPSSAYFPQPLRRR